MNQASFLRALFPSAVPGWVEIRRFTKNRDEPPVSTWHKPNEVPPVWPNNIDVYFSVCLRSTHGKRTADSVEVVTCLWADIDDKNGIELTDRIANYNPPPTIITHTGGGRHCYWLLKEPTAPSKYLTWAMKKFAKDLRGDSVYDYARILRLPGSYNNKYEPPRFCRVIVNRSQSQRCIHEAKALETIGARFEAEQEKAATTAAPRGYIAPVGRSVLCEAFNLARLAWREGQRHEAALAYAGVLLRAGKDLAEAEEAFRFMCGLVGDPEVEDRLRALRDTYRSTGATTGLSTLKKLGDK